MEPSLPNVSAVVSPSRQRISRVFFNCIELFPRWSWNVVFFFSLFPPFFSLRSPFFSRPMLLSSMQRSSLSRGGGFLSSRIFRMVLRSSSSFPYLTPSFPPPGPFRSVKPAASTRFLFLRESEYDSRPGPRLTFPPRAFFPRGRASLFFQIPALTSSRSSLVVFSRHEH